MRWRVTPSVIGGQTHVPGDKSIAHRALMLASLAPGFSRVDRLPAGADVHSTAQCLRQLGVDIGINGDAALVTSTGRLSASRAPLDAGNSGTTMRLLAGILAAQPFTSCLIGDESLSRRPMTRVVEPLNSMGASIHSNKGGAPLEIHGRQLHGIDFTLPVASAQVKSGILLAGLFTDGITSVLEPHRSRDHTERMLAALGVEIEVENLRATLRGSQAPRDFTMSVPGDLSSASFLVVAAALSGGEVTIDDVGLNPTRSGLLDVLREMGADIEISDQRREMGEPVGRLWVGGRIRRPVTVEAAQVPGLVDELPVVVLLATQAPGTSVIRGAAELRVKETDRIATVAASLRRLGADLDELADGFVVRGPTALHGCNVSSHGDHRLAMLLAVAGAIADGETVVDGVEAADVSFPNFAEVLRSLGGTIEHL
ncbi:MAG: 3-phosphoshikimate 1-carboxyvinyltransferase [Chloroflexota bacterium]|nr:3-phosphoshikimate 1-carboxyvinyltransferase [Chloroflexota bacterium]